MNRYLIIVLFFVSLFASQVRSESLARNVFLGENPNGKPWCIWYWMHGCVSKEGIKADLKAMHDIGLGGAYLMPIRGVESPSVYEPAIEQLTPEWWDVVRFAMEEAEKQDLKLGMHICDGFALAGGPWIKPEQSMQKLVWTDTQVTGNKMLNLKLAQPETNYGFYKDVSVVAYPTPSGVGQKVAKPFRTTSSNTNTNLTFLADENGTGSFRSENPCWIQYEYNSPFLCRSIVTKVNGTNYQCHRFTVEASDDGIQYRYVAQLETPRHGWQNTGSNVTHAIPPTKARFFRFHWTKEGSGPGSEDLDNAKWSPVLKLSGLYLSPNPRIHQYEGKNGSVWRLCPATTEQQLKTDICVPEDQLIDITSCLSQDGLLRWNAPKGNWTILRMGHTSTGMINATGGAGAGLECDKFSREAVQLQFDNWFGKACKVAGPELVSNVLTTMHIDSWECGSQNWSEDFAQAFEKKRGYSLLPYLPVMAGVPIGSANFSEQLLLDVRQTISELVNDVFFKTLVDAAHAYGCQVDAESVAPTMMSDGMLHYQTVDIPMGEFWLNSPTHDKPNDMLDAISGAHVYGKQIIQAEGFTQLRTTWEETPANLKSLLDRNFALGINKMVFHVFTHNPFMDRKPGMTLDGIGLFFQRDQTWWKPGYAWMDYIRRCQNLLQVGHPIVDIAVFNGFELPRRALLPDRLVPSMPGIFGADRVASESIRLANAGVPMTEGPVGVRHTANLANAEDWVNPLRGYAYDTFNPDVLFRLAKAENGRIVLPGGASYGLLIVPLPHPMAPDDVTPYADLEIRLRDVLHLLKEADVQILMPENLAKEFNVTTQLPWKENDFSRLGLKRDVEVSENGQPASNSIAYSHRADSALDIYFISNQKSKYRRLDVSLRVAGRVPELYDPLTGDITEILNWTTRDGCTHISLNMAPNASFFIVFEQPTNETSNQSEQSEAPRLETIVVEGPWSVQFDTAYGGPAEPVFFDTLTSWATHANPDITYYSGTAEYTNHFSFVAEPVENGCYKLNLGTLADVADVSVNGIHCGVVWTAPYNVDITHALKQGQNLLKICITNTWANRLEGDALLSENERVTWTDGKYRKKTRTLLDAGLFGPLQLESSNTPAWKLISNK